MSGGGGGMLTKMFWAHSMEFGHQGSQRKVSTFHYAGPKRELQALPRTIVVSHSVFC